MKSFPTSKAIIAVILVFSLQNRAQEWEGNTDASWSEPSSVEESAPLQESSSYQQSAPYGDQDATYVIKPGDTLWDLAFQFLGDPFQWQRIWQLNGYITNPDLIFPGNRLQLPGRYSSTASGSESPTEGSSITSPSFNSETVSAFDSTSDLIDEMDSSSAYPGDSLIISSMRFKEVVSRGYLAKMPFLWTEKDPTGNMFPGNSIVTPPALGQSYQLFSTLTFKPIKGATYQAGDTVDIISSLRFLRFNDKPANLVRRVGRACITSCTREQGQAILFEMFDAIVGKERVAPQTIFSRFLIDTLVDPRTSISATVFTRVEQTASPYLYQMIILDKGSTQGIEVGDVFGIFHREVKGGPERLVMIGSIGHTGTASSTLSIIWMAHNQVDEGDKAVLLRRIRRL